MIYILLIKRKNQLDILQKLKNEEIDKVSYINRGFVWANKQSWINRIGEVLQLLKDNVYLFWFIYTAKPWRSLKV